MRRHCRRGASVPLLDGRRLPLLYAWLLLRRPPSSFCRDFRRDAQPQGNGRGASHGRRGRATASYGVAPLPDGRLVAARQGRVGGDSRRFPRDARRTLRTWQVPRARDCGDRACACRQPPPGNPLVGLRIWLRFPGRNVGAALLRAVVEGEPAAGHRVHVRGGSLSALAFLCVRSAHGGADNDHSRVRLLGAAFSGARRTPRRSCDVAGLHRHAQALHGAVLRRQGRGLEGAHRWRAGVFRPRLARGRSRRQREQAARRRRLASLAEPHGHSCDDGGSAGQAPCGASCVPHDGRRGDNEPPFRRRVSRRRGGGGPHRARLCASYWREGDDSQQDRLYKRTPGGMGWKGHFVWKLVPPELWT